METTNLLPIEKETLANRIEIRANSMTGSPSYKVKYGKLKIRPGHNDRTQFGDLEGFADNIEAVGLISPIRVDMLKNGDCIVTNGERRTRAIGILIDRGSKRFNETDKCVPVIINPTNFTEVDRIKISLSENNLGKPFEPIEEANSFRKLLGQIDPDTKKIIRAADIARIMGCSKMHVTNRLLLAGISDEEKDAVNEGTISSTAMTDLVKNGMDEEQRKELINEAKQNGKTLQVKDVKSKKESGSSAALDRLKDDEYTNNSPRDKNDEINEVMGQTGNAEADHQEKQDQGLFKPKKGSSFNVFDLASEAIIMTNGISHEVHKNEFSLEAITTRIDNLLVTLRDIQKIGKAL